MDEDISQRRKRILAQSLCAEVSRLAQNSVSSAESSDTSSEDEGEVNRLKPVFVPKAHRAIIATCDTEGLREPFSSKQRQAVVNEALLDELVEFDSEQVAPMLGFEDSKQAYEAWRLRELNRILAQNR